MITIVEVTVRKSITVNNGNFQIEIKLPFGLLSQFGHVDQRVTIHFGDNFSSGGVGKGLVYQLTDCKSNWCKSWRNHVISQVVSKSKRQMLSVLSSVPPLPAPPPAQSQPNQVDALLILHHKTQGGFFWFFFSVTSLGCKFISCENSRRDIRPWEGAFNGPWEAVSVFHFLKFVFRILGLFRIPISNSEFYFAYLPVIASRSCRECTVQRIFSQHCEYVLLWTSISYQWGLQVHRV